MPKYLLLILILLSFKTGYNQKIAGVHLESTQEKSNSDYVHSVKRISTNWIAIIPFLFMNNTSPQIAYNCEKNWWGSTPEGIKNTVKYAKKSQIKTFLKPHFWVDNVGWAGELDFSKKDWTTWETNYTKLILDFAILAESIKIDMLCIGVELKSSINERPQFWMELIPKIKALYHGKITYAANWDNYSQIPFWDQLDYIGIDAYFPLSQQNLPSKKILLQKWKYHSKEIARFTIKNNKPILFTEMGYRSTNKCAGNQWEIENRNDTTEINMASQVNAFNALFETFWQKEWFAGGFIWEWHTFDNNAGGISNSNYTPQHKPSEKIIKQWFDIYQ